MLCFYAYDELALRFWPSGTVLSGNFQRVALRFFCAGIVSIVLATASRRFFEEYFLRLKDQFAGQSGSRNGIPGPCTNEVELPMQDTVAFGDDVVCDRVSY